MTPNFRTRFHPYGLGLLLALVASAASTALAQPYNVRGDFNAWDETPMVDDGDGTYSLTIDGFQASAPHEFKIATGGWAQAWPPTNAAGRFNSGDYYGDAGGFTFHFRPGPANDGWLPAADRVGYDDPKQFGWEIMGTFNNWDGGVDFDARQMKYQGNGRYMVEYIVATAGAHQWKARTSASWDISVGADFGNSAANATFTTTQSNQPVRFEIDLPNGRLRASPRVYPVSFSTPNPVSSGWLGYSVGGVADANGDGRGDVIAGAPGETVSAISGAGRAYFYSGATGSTLTTLQSPNITAGGNFGRSVAGVPDVNGDGRGDILVGAPVESPSGLAGAGRAYLFSGSTYSLLRTFVSPNAESGGEFGHSVAGVPDTDGDGRGDILIGARFEDPGASPSNAGRAYLFSGATGALLFTFVSPNEEASGLFGSSVAGVADLSGDGRGDVVIGAPDEDPGASPNNAGRAYVFNGATGALRNTLSSPNEEAGGGNFGFSVAGVPDLNGDNRGDIVVCAPDDDPDPTPTDCGAAYLHSGSTGTRLKTFISPHPEDSGQFGDCAAGVPDVNGDTFGDIIIGARFENPGSAPNGAGRAYLFSGANPYRLMRVFVSPTEEDSGSFGAAVAGVPDIDGSGGGDVVVGARQEGPISEGRAHLYGLERNVVLVSGTATTGANDGSDWNNAFTDLQVALDFIDDSAYAPAEVWVLAGTYRPAESPAVHVSFNLGSGVAVYGGFDGSETSLAQRDPVANVTVLSGDLWGNDTARPAWPSLPPSSWADNSYHVVEVPAFLPLPAILDGVTITAGYASTATGNNLVGGGIEIASDAIIRDCVISNNVALDRGGGLRVVTGMSGEPDDVRIENCAILSNSALTHGGASAGVPTLFLGCDFLQNTATNWSGALGSSGADQVTDCTFVQNSTTATGGGGGAIRMDGGTSLFTGCTFDTNTAKSGGAIDLFFSASPVFQECLFTGNVANGTSNLGRGGAVSVSISGGSSQFVRFTDCLFSANVANRYGGAIIQEAENSFVVATGCDFDGNSATNSGGGIYHVAGTVHLTGCTVTNCTSNIGTGGLHLAGVSATIDNSDIITNSSANQFQADGISAGNLTLSGDVTLSGNGTNFFNSPNAIILGALSLQDDTVVVKDGGVMSGMSIALYPGSALNFGSGSAGDAGTTLLNVDLMGNGAVFVDRYNEVRFQGTFIDLSPIPVVFPQCLDPRTSDTSNWGMLTLDGVVHVEGGTVQNSKIVVEDDVTVSDCGNETGGRLIFESGGSLTCNDITTYGDRYAVFSGFSPPVVSGNLVHAIITLDSDHSEQGELFDLRQDDLTCPECPPGLNYLSGSDPAYLSPWALEMLEVLPDAKVNLTNRSQLPGPGKALYARTIKLHPGAILNTAFQRVYYDTLVDEGGTILDPGNLPPDRDVKDIPLLGFSLGVITFENQCEFDVRIDKRTAGLQSGNGTITRITSNGGGRPIPDGAGGILDMKALTADSIAARGAFNKQGEDEIIVHFKYLFPQPGDTGELWVYLSHEPYVGDSRTHIATITQPTPSDAPGGPDAANFALFYGRFPRPADFAKGTYVELELKGANSRVWIDDWDPVVCAWCSCGDMSGYIDEQGFPVSDCGVTGIDYLYLLSEFGHAVNDFNTCADQLGSDNYVDLTDLLAWSSQFHSDVLNLCEGSGSPSGGVTDPVGVLPAGAPVISGKPGAPTLRGAMTQDDTLFALDAQTKGVIAAAPAPGRNPATGVRSGHGRLITNADGALHQVHGSMGLIRVEDGAVVLGPRTYAPNCPTSNSVVRLGLTGNVAFPIMDVAFDPIDPDIVYVAPVQVDPPQVCSPPALASPGCPYRAAAKVRLSSTSCGSITVLGGDPHATSSVRSPCTANCADVVFNPDTSRVREIEVDQHANVFVLSAQEVNDNDYVIIYQAGYPDTGSAFEIPISGQVQAPAAMHVGGDKLYLSTSLDGPDATNTKVWRYAIDRDGSDKATGISLETTIDVTGMRFITGMSTNPADGALWAVGFASTTCTLADCQADPNCPGGCVYSVSDSIFAVPMLAMISDPEASPSVEVQPLTGYDLSLPIGLVFPSGIPCATGDFDDGGLGISDVPLFVAALLNPTPETLCLGDMNADADLNALDIQPFVDALLAP